MQSEAGSFCPSTCTESSAYLSRNPADRTRTLPQSYAGPATGSAGSVPRVGRNVEVPTDTSPKLYMTSGADILGNRPARLPACGRLNLRRSSPDEATVLRIAGPEGFWTMRSPLRLFTGEEDGIYSEPPQVTMTLGEFCRILTQAQNFDSTWLEDFADDEIQMPLDLHEVMSSYWTLRPGA
jgi:hypothetical protein